MESIHNFAKENIIVLEALKDDTRINDIISKAKGNSEKEQQLARTMATKITNKSKALDRYQAALNILGADHQVTQIFAGRAVELGHNIKGLKPQEKIELTKEYKLATDQGSSAMSKGRQASQLYMVKNKHNFPVGCPILPCGKLNLRNGNNKYFNVYDNREQTIEIFKLNDTWEDENSKSKYVAIITSGNGPILKIGEKTSYCHDQNHRTLFFGQIIDWLVVSKDAKNLEEIIKKYGITSLNCYVYK